MYRSKPCLPYFSAVVKNIASPNVEIKKLVYIFLLHYAESEPDLALLSINTIQKSLTDQSPQIRAMALRVMSGIRVPVISQIVSLAIKRGIADMNPYVRKAAALAIPKCYRLDPSTLPQMLEYLSSLLGDKQYFVVGPAVVAFLEVCPDRIDLIHGHYRALVRKIVDMDEWGQLATLRLLTYYARQCFPRRFKHRRKNKPRAFYDEDSSGGEDDGSGEKVQMLDPDLELLLKACKPLLTSRSSAVIVAAVKCLLYLGQPDDLDAAVGPLVALIRTPQDVQSIAMCNIVAVCLIRPELFVRHATRFLLHVTDSPEVCSLKLEILSLIFPHCEGNLREMILSELEHFTRSDNVEVVRESVRSIGRCAQNDPKASMRCLRLLLQQLSSQDGNLVAESLTVIRHLIQQAPQIHKKTVIRLAKNLDTTVNPSARATIIWLVGESSGMSDDENIAPDVLRILTKGFADESEAAKLQIVLLAAKVYLHYLIRTKSASDQQDSKTPAEQTPENVEATGDESEQTEWTAKPDQPTEHPSPIPDDHPIPRIWRHILQLVRYDTSYDLRDRTRLYSNLLAHPSSTQLASLMLLAPKPVPHTPSPSENRTDILIGSSSLVLGNTDMKGYEDLPEWVQDGREPDPKLREEATGMSSRSAHVEMREAPAVEELDRAVKEKGLGKVGGDGKEKSLDEWLNEEGEEGSTEKETDEDEGSYETDDDDDEEDDEEEEGEESESEEGPVGEDEKARLVAS